MRACVYARVSTYVYMNMCWLGKNGLRPDGTHRTFGGIKWKQPMIVAVLTISAGIPNDTSPYLTEANFSAVLGAVSPTCSHSNSYFPLLAPKTLHERSIRHPETF